MQRVDAQRLQKAMLATIQETKQFDMIKCSKHTNSEQNIRPFGLNTQTTRKCCCCSMNHRPWHCPAYSRTCLKANHFQQVCRNPSRDKKQDRLKGNLKPIHDGCQSDDTSWEGSDKEIDRAIDMVTIRSFRFDCV